MKTLEEIALQIGKEVFGAEDCCLSGQGERDREVTVGEYPIGEGCIDFARRLVAALGAQKIDGRCELCRDFDEVIHCINGCHERKPVGYVRAYALEHLSKPGQTVINHKPLSADDVPLFAAPVVNPDWQMVPKEPTPEMVEAGRWEDGVNTARNVWHYMLAAAPEHKP